MSRAIRDLNKNFKMKKYFYADLSTEKIRELCARSGIDVSKIEKIVHEIETNISKNGDDEIRNLTEKFDGVRLENFAVSQKDFENASNLIDENFKTAIKIAAKNIRKFHEKSADKNISAKIETTTGVECWRESRAIETVGLYIPGGTAPLFSTILMTAIPAQIAGVSKIILCTPPNKKFEQTGFVAPEILWTAKFLELEFENIFRIGGAQAIFSMADGTAQIPKVDKIFGPGNAFVMAAKSAVSPRVAIDMPAGPSEVLIVADQNSNAEFVAADALSQLEHGPDSQTVLIIFGKNSEKKSDEILNKIFDQNEKLPRREIAKKSLKNSFILIAENFDDAIEFSNIYAPEHLILNIKNADKILSKIKNVGSVFVGENACESFGDYASGTNHILPTSGFAKSFSGVSVNSFLKKITFQKVSNLGLKNLGPTVEILADREDLFAHKNAISIRLKNLKK